MLTEIKGNASKSDWNLKHICFFVVGANYEFVLLSASGRNLLHLNVVGSEWTLRCKCVQRYKLECCPHVSEPSFL